MAYVGSQLPCPYAALCHLPVPAQCQPLMCDPDRRSYVRALGLTCCHISVQALRCMLGALLTPHLCCPLLLGLPAVILETQVWSWVHGCLEISSMSSRNERFSCVSHLPFPTGCLHTWLCYGASRFRTVHCCPSMHCLTVFMSSRPTHKYNCWIPALHHAARRWPSPSGR